MTKTAFRPLQEFGIIEIDPINHFLNFQSDYICHFLPPNSILQSSTITLFTSPNALTFTLKDNFTIQATTLPAYHNSKETTLLNIDIYTPNNNEPLYTLAIPIQNPIRTNFTLTLPINYKFTFKIEDTSNLFITIQYEKITK